MAGKGAKTLDEGTQDRLRALVREIIAEVGDQVKAAARLGISQGYLSEFVSGKRGGGGKLLRGVAALRPQRLAEVMGTSASPKALAVSDSATAPSRYSNRDQAIALLVQDGKGTEAQVREAADRVAVALDADEDPTVLRWVEMIRPFIRPEKVVGEREMEDE